MRRKMIILFGLAVLIQWIADAQAQDQWSWPEKPQNLQILPNDWPGSRLAPVMQGFSRALGVRCSYCHVGEENQPLSTYDFASDANPNKKRARLQNISWYGEAMTILKKSTPAAPNASTCGATPVTTDVLARSPSKKSWSKRISFKASTRRSTTLTNSKKNSTAAACMILKMKIH